MQISLEEIGKAQHSPGYVALPSIAGSCLPPEGTCNLCLSEATLILLL